MVVVMMTGKREWRKEKKKRKSDVFYVKDSAFGDFFPSINKSSSVNFRSLREKRDMKMGLFSEKNWITDQRTRGSLFVSLCVFNMQNNILCNFNYT